MRLLGETNETQKPGEACLDLTPIASELRALASQLKSTAEALSALAGQLDKNMTARLSGNVAIDTEWISRRST